MGRLRVPNLNARGVNRPPGSRPIKAFVGVRFSRRLVMRNESGSPPVRPFLGDVALFTAERPVFQKIQITNSKASRFSKPAGFSLSKKVTERWPFSRIEEKKAV